MLYGRILVYVLLTAVEGSLDTAHLTRCVATLEQAFGELGRHDPEEILYAKRLAAVIGGPTDG